MISLLGYLFYFVIEAELDLLVWIVKGPVVVYLREQPYRSFSVLQQGESGLTESSDLTTWLLMFVVL